MGGACLAAEQSDKVGKRRRAMPTMVHYQDAGLTCQVVHTDFFTPTQLLNSPSFSDPAQQVAQLVAVKPSDLGDPVDVPNQV
jgi:hypothetical protein